MEEIGIFDHTVQQQQQRSEPAPISTVTRTTDGEEDLYIKFKKLQRQIDFIQVNSIKY